MLLSNVILWYQLNGPKLSEYQFNKASSLIQWIGKMVLGASNVVRHYQASEQWCYFEELTDFIC